jgi:hypothetical protein
MPTQIVTTFPPRQQLEFVRGDLSVLLPLTAAANGVPISQGDVLGIITSSGLGRRRTRAIVGTGGVLTSSPTFPVADSSMFAAGDVLTDDSGNTVGTVNSVNTSASPNTVTLAANSAHAVAAGVGVIATDGSAVAQGISDDSNDGVTQGVVSVLITGLLNASLLRGLDSVAITQLGGALMLGGEVFKF